MNMHEVPEEWKTAGYRAFDWAIGRGMNWMTAVLAEVAPMIQAAERERCARAADGKSDEWAAEWRRGLKGSSYKEGMADGADEIAAAIRALTAPSTPPAQPAPPPPPSAQHPAPPQPVPAAPPHRAT